MAVFLSKNELRYVQGDRDFSKEYQVKLRAGIRDKVKVLNEQVKVLKNSEFKELLE